MTQAVEGKARRFARDDAKSGRLKTQRTDAKMLLGIAERVTRIC